MPAAGSMPTIHLTKPPGDWIQHAACNDTNYPDAWFATELDPLAAQSAKAVCRACPVRHDCLSFALREAIPHGIWGGASEKERAGMLKKMRAAS